MKTAFLLLLSFIHLSPAAEVKGQPSPFVTRFFKATLLFAAAPVELTHGDPLTVAKTPEQRRFLKEYYRVHKEDPFAWRRDQTYPLMEPLRRCGFTFPKGTVVIWTPLSVPIRVTHTPAVMKEIVKYMGLTPDK